MKEYIFQRLIQLVPILIGITFLTFAMMQVSTIDAVDFMYEHSGSVSDAVKAAKRAELGLDKPFIVQYGNWLTGVLTGDMGRSFISGKLVFETFRRKTSRNFSTYDGFNFAYDFYCNAAGNYFRRQSK